MFPLKTSIKGSGSFQLPMSTPFWVSLLGVYYKLMDWFKGNFAGNPHDLHGKIDGFRLGFSCQSIEKWLESCYPTRIYLKDLAMRYDRRPLATSSSYGSNGATYTVSFSGSRLPFFWGPISF
jgi:hypothetical protein